jgi:predicted N-acyltransferase
MIGALLSIHTTIRDVDQRQWDELAGDNAFATRAWLLTMEASWRAKARPLYVLHWQAQILTAGAVAYVVERSPGIETLDDLVFGRLEPAASALGVSLLPALVCGPALGYGWHVGVRRGTTPEQAGAATMTVVEALEREARTQGLGLHFAHVVGDEIDLRAALESRGYLRALGVPTSVLDIRWPTLDGYVGSLPVKMRKELRRQMNRNREAGVRIEVVGPGDVLGDERALGLFQTNARKHDSREFPCGAGFTDLLRQNCGERLWLLVARRDQQTTGVLVALRQGDTLFAQSIGVDSEAAHDYTYFRLAYYSAIERAIAANVRRIYFGRGAYDVKVRRGCSLENTWIYSRASGASRLGLAAWYRVASAWNRRKLPASARRALTG